MLLSRQVRLVAHHRKPEGINLKVTRSWLVHPGFYAAVSVSDDFFLVSRLHWHREAAGLYTVFVLVMAWHGALGVA